MPLLSPHDHDLLGAKTSLALLYSRMAIFKSFPKNTTFCFGGRNVVSAEVTTKTVDLIRILSSLKIPLSRLIENGAIVFSTKSIHL